MVFFEPTKDLYHPCNTKSLDLSSYDASKLWQGLGSCPTPRHSFGGGISQLSAEVASAEKKGSASKCETQAGTCARPLGDTASSIAQQLNLQSQLDSFRAQFRVFRLQRPERLRGGMKAIKTTFCSIQLRLQIGRCTTV